MAYDFEEFIKILNKEDKDAAVNFAINLLETKKIDLKDFYQNYLAKSLHDFDCKDVDSEICIWKEHTRTSIIRTILEISYPYVIKEKAKVNKINKKVMVVCPSQELHEIGAIIINNYFLLAGYNSQFIGANTPKNDIISAVKILKPDYLAISVTNYYNLVVTKQIVDEIKTKYPNVKIIVGGQSFLQKGATEQINYDYYMSSLEDIIKFEKVQK